MVFFFAPRGCDPPSDDFKIYMGLDKFENEDLIKYGLPHDVWFHVDNLSSAHVYLRLPEGATVEDIPAETLEDCAQLVKANSIQGSKQTSVDIVYTMWSNLRKTASMEVGQIGFRVQKAVKKVAVHKKSNDIINRLNRTKKEEFPNFAALREEFDAGVRKEKRIEMAEQRRAEKSAKEENKQLQELRSYKGLMQVENMTSNTALAQKYESAADYEDDFM